MLPTLDVMVSAALAIAAASDLASRRIPNILALTAGLLGLAVSAGTHQLLSGIAAALICLFVTVPLWRRGLVGGGDVKLTAAAAAWVALDHLIAFVLVVALCGGVLSVIALVRASATERRLVRANTLASLATSKITVARSPGTSIPYGLAIAAGAAAVEFALVLPLLLTILFGTIEWGYYFFNRQIVINSAREGARVGTLQSKQTSDAVTAAQGYLTRSGLILKSGAVGGTVYAKPVTLNGSTVTEGTCPAESSCIGIVYWLPSLTGFLDTLLGSTRTIVAYAEMRK